MHMCTGAHRVHMACLHMRLGLRPALGPPSSFHNRILTTQLRSECSSLVRSWPAGPARALKAARASLSGPPDGFGACTHPSETPFSSPVAGAPSSSSLFTGCLLGRPAMGRRQAQLMMSTLRPCLMMLFISLPAVANPEGSG